MSAVTVYVHLAGREPVRLSGAAALAAADRFMAPCSSMVIAEAVEQGLIRYDSARDYVVDTELGNAVTEVLRGELGTTWCAP